MSAWKMVGGIVVEGYHVASGPSKDYPYGALDRQKPLFMSQGLDLSGYFNGTLNIDISPLRFRLVSAEVTLRQVRWTDLHPPEDFSFSRCMVVHVGVEYYGWVYYPHPETKIRHFQNPSLLEVIAMHIPSIQYGDRVVVKLNEAEIEVRGS